jgi:hypothetical protein
MRLLMCGAVLALATVVTAAPATQPGGAASPAALELRASETFNKGDFASALPILQKVAGQLQSQPAQADQLAMVQEQIRVCQRNLSAPPPPSATVSQTASTALPPLPGSTAIASATPQPSTALPPLPGSAAGSAVTSVGDASAIAAANGSGPVIPMGADRIPHPAPKPGEVLEMSIKELGNFEFDPEHPTPLPGDIQRLSGATVRLRGYMIPMDQAESITQFALVPSLFACCYGQPPQIQHTIVVSTPKGKAVSYYPDEIVVQGKLNVQQKKDDGFIVSLFEISAQSVKPAPK